MKRCAFIVGSGAMRHGSNATAPRLLVQTCHHINLADVPNQRRCHFLLDHRQKRARASQYLFVDWFIGVLAHPPPRLGIVSNLFVLLRQRFADVGKPLQLLAHRLKLLGVRGLIALGLSHAARSGARQFVWRLVAACPCVLSLAARRAVAH